MFTAAKFIQQHDPADPGIWEILLTYSGFHAVGFYRIAHYFWQHKHRLLAMLISHWGKKATGVEIHPAAVIGKNLFIDHGLGVVIGETAVIGNQVTILQNVTLGSRRPIPGLRHPHIADNVFIGANAQILGAVKIGEYAKIGAGSVVLNNVPAHRTIVGNPGRLVD